MRVVVYTKPHCQPCRGTKVKLKKLGIEFLELPAQEHIDHLANLGYLSAPVVEVDYGEGVTTSWSDFRPDLIQQLSKTL